MAGDKTEKATPKKRRDSRKEGEVVKSIELNNAFSLAAIILVIKVFSSRVGSDMLSFFQSSLTITDINQPIKIQEFFTTFLGIVAPFLMVGLLVGVTMNYMQIGFLFVPKNLLPKGNRLNPLQGVKRIFSKKSLFSSVKTTIKLFVIFSIAYSSIQAVLSQPGIFLSGNLYESLQRMLDTVVSIGIKITIGLFANGILDYIFEWMDHENKIKMTKQEIKDEYKKTEGDPQIKSNIRSKQMAMARMRMMQSVPDADAVIVNPTHYAIAVKYEMGVSKAPKVVAKGKGHVALRIKQIAIENGVYIAENKQLARILYAKVEIGDTIPYEQFQAVAEIIAYVYNMKNKIRGEV